MSIQYRKHDYFYFQKDKKKYFQNTEKHPKPNWFKIKKKKTRSHADKICPDSKSKHLGDRE